MKNLSLINKVNIILLAAFCVFLCGINANAQTIIAQQGFETPAATPVWNYTAAGGAVSTDNGATDSPANSRIRTGTASYQVNNTTGTLTFDNVTIPSGYSSLRVNIYVSSPSANATNGSDATDTVAMTVALNGGAFSAAPDINLVGNANSRYDYNDTDGVDTTTAGTPITVTAAGGATNTTPKRSAFQINIPDGTTSVALRITALNNNVSEFWNIDDVTLSGLAPTAAGATINGRITDVRGRGLGRVVVMMTGSGVEEPIYATTNPFGYYRFEDIPTGNTYVLTAFSKSYTFDQSSIVVNVNNDLAGADFIGQRRFSVLNEVKKASK